MTEADLPTFETFPLWDFRLQSGQVLPEACLAYKTYGKLNAARSNVILYPTSYGAQHTDIDWLIGSDRILNPDQHFIIIPNMFGNGLSTSPSNLLELAEAGQLPNFTHVDNITAQRKLLEEVFGIDRIALAYGWSMGGQQALHWGALFPKKVERIAALCTAAKTSPHNIVFLEGLRTALIADPAWDGKRFIAKPERGLRAFGRIYAGWAMSQAFYRQGIHLELGYDDLESYLVGDWEATFLRRDPMNLLSMIATWQRSDISDNDVYQGDLARALGSIRAKTLFLPGTKDLYFTPEDSQEDARQVPGAECRPIPSVWGHRAGNPVKSPPDEQFLKAAISELLSA